MSRGQVQLGQYYNAAEMSMVFLPRNYKRDGSKRLVIFVHGAGGSYATAGSGSANFNLLGQIADILGLPLLSIDAGSNGGLLNSVGVTGGANNFGNSTAVAAIDAAITYGTTAATQPAGYTQNSNSAIGALGPPVILIGYSMGGMGVLNHAARNPTRVKAIITVAGGYDLNDIQTNNRGGYAAQITTAYGGNWATNGQGASPSYNPSLNVPAGLKAIPHQLWYSTGDTVVLPATATGYATTYGANCTALAIPGAPGHGLAMTTIAADATSNAAFLAFLAANA